MTTDTEVLEDILREYIRSGVAILYGCGRRPLPVDGIRVLAQSEADALQAWCLNSNGSAPLPLIRIAKMSVEQSRITILDPNGRRFTLAPPEPRQYASHRAILQLVDCWRRSGQEIPRAQ
jgi:hypothetical protein